MKWSLRWSHGSHPYGGPYMWWRAPWIQSEWGLERRFSLGLLCLFFRSWLHGGWWSDRNLGHTWSVLCQWLEPSAPVQKPRGALLKTDLKPPTWLIALSFRRLCGTLVWRAVDLRETVRAGDAFSITYFQKKQTDCIEARPWRGTALVHSHYLTNLMLKSLWIPQGHTRDYSFRFVQLCWFKGSRCLTKEKHGNKTVEKSCVPLLILLLCEKEKKATTSQPRFQSSQIRVPCFKCLIIPVSLSQSPFPN